MHFLRGLISKSISSHQLAQKYHRIHHFPNCYVKAMFRRVKCALRQEQTAIRNAMKDRRKGQLMSTQHAAAAEVTGRRWGRERDNTKAHPN